MSDSGRYSACVSIAHQVDSALRNVRNRPTFRKLAIGKNEYFEI